MDNATETNNEDSRDFCSVHPSMRGQQLDPSWVFTLRYQRTVHSSWDCVLEDGRTEASSAPVDIGHGVPHLPKIGLVWLKNGLRLEMKLHANVLSGIFRY